MKNLTNPYINATCPVTGKKIVTNPKWDLILPTYKIFFGVLDGRIILHDCHGTATGETSALYEKLVQRVIKEAIVPGATYATCDNYANFSHATAGARKVVVENFRKYHPNLRALYYYKVPPFINFVIKATKNYIKVPFKFDTKKTYDEALESAYKSIDLPFPAVKQTSDAAIYVSLPEWKFMCGDREAAFKVTRGNIIVSKLYSGMTFEQITTAGKIYLEVIKYIYKTTGLNIYHAISDISEMPKTNSAKRKKHIEVMKDIDNMHPCSSHCLVGSSIFIKVTTTFLRITTPYKVYNCSTVEEALKALEKEHTDFNNSASEVDEATELLLSFLSTISLKNQGIHKEPDCPTNSNLHSMYEALQMFKEDIFDVFEERNKSEEQLKKITKELQIANDELEARVHQRTKELRAAKELAEKANRSKSDFLAKISHELRTPMHGILSFSRFGILKAKSVSMEKIIHYFESINDSGNRLMTLVNHLLDLSRLESGKMPFVIKPNDLFLNINAIRSQLSQLITENEMTLTIDECEFGLIHYDKDRIMQVFTNLIGNAIKFSNQGGNIHIKFNTIEHDGVKFGQIQVHDDGVGIPAEDINAIFDSFSQSSKTTVKTGGTGLGLSICKEIINAHNGRIYATSLDEKGSIFTVELPLSQNQK